MARCSFGRCDAYLPVDQMGSWLVCHAAQKVILSSFFLKLQAHLIVMLAMLQKALLHVHVLQAVSQRHWGRAPQETPGWVASLT